MVTSCVVCYSTCVNTKSISFHRFPLDEARKELWIEKLGLKERKKPITKYHKVCSKHFAPSSFMHDTAEKKILYPDAVPLSYTEIMDILRAIRLSREESN